MHVIMKGLNQSERRHPKTQWLPLNGNHFKMAPNICGQIESFPDQKLASGHHGDSWTNK